MKTVKYEDVLHMLGNFGRYQYFVFVWYTLAVFMMSCHFSYMTFAGAVPQGQCDFAFNSSMSENENCTVQFYSIVVEYDLLGDRTYLTEMATSIQMAGMFIGPIFAGQVSDRFGRKYSFLVSYVGIIVFGIISSLSVNLTMFLAFRFFVGFALTAASCINFIWYIEFIPERYRLINNYLGWGGGNVWFALLAYLIPKWRALGYWINIPAVIVIPMTFVLKESPKWLLERGKTSEAFAVFETMAKWNKVDFEKISHCRVEGASAADGNRTYSYWHLFYSRRAAVHTVALGLSWMIIACVYFSLFYNLSNFGGNIFLIFAILNISRNLSNVLTVLVDTRYAWFTRRMCNMVGLVGVFFPLIGIIACYLAPPSDTTKMAEIVLAVFGMGFGAGRVWLVQENWIAEIFPTVLRNIGYGFCSFVSRIGGIIGPQIFLLYYKWKPGPFIIFLAMTCAAMGLNFVLPETKGQPLPDLPGQNVTDEPSIEEGGSVEKMN